MNKSIDLFRFENKEGFVYAFTFILGIRYLCIDRGIHLSQTLSNSEQSCVYASEMDVGVGLCTYMYMYMYVHICLDGYACVYVDVDAY